MNKVNIEKHLDLLIRKLRVYYNSHEPEDVSHLIDKYVLATQEGIDDDELEEFDEDIKKDYYSFYFDTHFSSVVNYFDELDDKHVSEFLGYYSGNGLYIDEDGKGLLLIQL